MTNYPSVLAPGPDDEQWYRDHGWTEQKSSVPTLAEFLADDDDDYDWLVPGLLERGDRVILTGPEGGGKSTLCRQLAVQLSAGIHPFGGPVFLPLRVLLLDLENSVRQTRRALRPLVAVAGSTDLTLAPVVRPQGLDLLQQEDITYLSSIIEEINPDIVIGGPLYKLAGGDPTDEKTARPVALLLDRLRTAHDFALVLEAHSPHASGGGARPKRPYGASLWLRWPEFGIHLDQDGKVSHWRGQRDERTWPIQLQRGGAWPWTVVDRERDILWIQIVQHCQQIGHRPSHQKVADAIGSTKTNVYRAAQEHLAEWEALATKGAE